MPRLALFLERPSVEGVFIVECYSCDWYTDYYDYQEPWRHTFGTRDQAFEQVGIHSREKRHGAPRVVKGVRA